MLVRVRCLVPVFLLCIVGACVERRLFIRTEPEGATVRVNGQRIGTSPTEWRFTHYGTVLVEAELHGHEGVQQEVLLRSPWYQKPVVDFFSDVLVPAKIKDDHEVTLQLAPLPEMTEEDVQRELKALEAAARKARDEANE